MRVKYAPEGGTAQEWSYSPAKVRQSQAEMVEKRSGMDWDAFNKSLLSGNARARKVLLWHLLTREHPVYRWEDVPDFAMAELTVEFDAKELGDLRAAVVAAKDMDGDTRESALALLDEQLATAGDPGFLAPAPSNDSAAATGA